MGDMLLARLVDVSGRTDDVDPALQLTADTGPHERMVVDHEDPRRAHL